MWHCLDCGRLVGETWDGRCADCLRVYWDPEWQPTDTASPDAADLDPSDAGTLAGWSGHDWYADLGSEGGHE